MAAPAAVRLLGAASKSFAALTSPGANDAGSGGRDTGADAAA
eukprot:CAMPEP_0202869956 /NCGR_PEP_ID=MMETSP1391-20130828/14019_1 /ASSEMBLY_ACC=CAM_ASM_000867 /TAXON_ID=1034604 /ORGANISM="Chlamydomonas leiostraca, Strain SAG 11-49" /LENGTH=41 /DNA_ID= /DNA_START= /DNA_END= /DNA_ORIENTATION=